MPGIDNDAELLRRDPNSGHAGRAGADKSHRPQDECRHENQPDAGYD